MTVEKIIANFKPEDIKQAAHKLEIEEKIHKILKDSRWKDTPLLQDKKTFLIPLLDYGDRRPLAVTLHDYGLWIVPIYTSYKGSGKPDSDFALHIEESDDGLYIHIEDALAMTLKGSYEKGFTLEITETDKKTKIIDETPKYRG